jgi:hydroxymethylpyrimidine pyrophosphatase-like HAD family hydrolase
VLFSFDFDGTLHDPATTPGVPPELFSELRRLHAERKLSWGINTGRSFGYLMEGLHESRFPFAPDWVVAREFEIYLPNHFGRWLPHRPWNQQCHRDVHRLFRRSRSLFCKIRSDLRRHTGAIWLADDGEPAGIISRTVEEMDWIVSHITPLAAEVPNLSWQRNTIYLRFAHRSYHKGSSLVEAARLLGIPKSNCLAVGDGHNDLEMLDPACCGMSACPANAVPEVVQKNRSIGGFVASNSYGPGTIEAIRNYFPISH